MHLLFLFRIISFSFRKLMAMIKNIYIHMYCRQWFDSCHNNILAGQVCATTLSAVLIISLPCMCYTLAFSAAPFSLHSFSKIEKFTQILCHFPAKQDNPNKSNQVLTAWVKRVGDGRYWISGIVRLCLHCRADGQIKSNDQATLIMPALCFSNACKNKSIYL